LFPVNAAVPRSPAPTPVAATNNPGPMVIKKDLNGELLLDMLI